MHKKRGFSPPAVGGSSLLVIFAVLCLTVFALLSLSTVRAGEKLGDSAARAVTGYYAADCAAEEMLARLRAGERPAEVKEEKGVFSYACPISDTQVLLVEVRLQGAEYQILRWQALSTAQWEADDSLPVWSGGEF